MVLCVCVCVCVCLCVCVYVFSAFREIRTDIGQGYYVNRRVRVFWGVRLGVCVFGCACVGALVVLLILLPCCQVALACETTQSTSQSPSCGPFQILPLPVPLDPVPPMSW